MHPARCPPARAPPLGRCSCRSIEAPVCSSCECVPVLGHAVRACSFAHSWVAARVPASSSVRRRPWDRATVDLRASHSDVRKRDEADGAHATGPQSSAGASQAAQAKLNGSGAAADEGVEGRQEAALRAERDQLAARAAGLQTTLADLSKQLAAAKVPPPPPQHTVTHSSGGAVRLRTPQQRLRWRSSTCTSPWSANMPEALHVTSLATVQRSNLPRLSPPRPLYLLE